MVAFHMKDLVYIMWTHSQRNELFTRCGDVACRRWETLVASGDLQAQRRKAEHNWYNKKWCTYTETQDINVETLKWGMRTNSGTTSLWVDIQKTLPWHTGVITTLWDPTTTECSESSSMQTDNNTIENRVRDVENTFYFFKQSPCFSPLYKHTT